MRQAVQEIARQVLSASSGEKKSPFFFIAGAGVSTPQIPLAREIIRMLPPVEHPPRHSSCMLERYSAALQNAYPSREERRAYFEGLILDKPISPAALRMAYLLAANQLITRLVTPNFDDFVIRAMNLFGKRCHVYDRPESLRRIGEESMVPEIIHVHGTYRDYDSANLKGEINETAKRRCSDLAGMMRERSPIVIGYSGWAEDVIMTALRERLQEPLRYRLYWFCYRDMDIKALPDWLKRHEDVTFVVPSKTSQARLLDARTVLQTLIDELRLPAPDLTIDPVGTFLKRLRTSLPLKDEKEKAWQNLYVFSQRLRGLYPNRRELGRFFHPVQVMQNAEHGSEICVAGRTLQAWASCHHEIAYFARERRLRFRFLLSSESASRDLTIEQQAEVKRDRGPAVARFAALQQQLGEYCEVRETPQLIIDGLTVSKVNRSLLDGEDSRDDHYRFMCQFDINAADGFDKPTLVLACTCDEQPRHATGSAADGDLRCTVHGLLDRTRRLFENARPLPEPTASPSSVIRMHEQGLLARRNGPQNYVHCLPQVFAATQQTAPPPAPLCVQMNVWSACDTHCRMCDHWRRTSSQDNIPLEAWKRILGNLRTAGVKAFVISGGEPLARPDIVELLRSACESRGQHDPNAPRIGLLTSGIVRGPSEKRRGVCEAIKECVDWVAISIDGTEPVDREIRNPAAAAQNRPRSDYLREFCEGIGGGSGPTLSATVTLQEHNVRGTRPKEMAADLEATCSFIHGLGIKSVNFKFATGGPASLSRPPGFLIEAQRVRQFFDTLFSSTVANDSDNNLAYLRRCFARGCFTVEDVASGTPLRSFYRSSPPSRLRCFTPFLFSLVDSTGHVYPCCHLYRDNHCHDPYSRRFRQIHAMGSIREDGDFLGVWRGRLYQQERERLAKVNPDDPDYLPCGECTRHFQPNMVINEFYRIFMEDPEGFKSWCGDTGPSAPEPPPAVWF